MEPKEGMMLIFPSYLTHMVEPHLSDDERISLSFNFRVAVKSQ
ncbi:MAG: putative 2OG-Fe(II) oxygenase [Pseudomonadota bacterium]